MMAIICRRIGASSIALALPYALMGLLSQCTQAPDPDPVVAEFEGGTISRAEYEAWLSYNGVLDSQTALEMMTINVALARELERRGDANLPELETVLESQRLSALVRALREHITSKVQVDPEEINRLLAKRPHGFDRPMKMRLHNLYKEHNDDPKERDAAHRQLESLRRRLTQGEDFEALAREFSDSQTRFSGGDLGWVDPNALPSSAAKEVSALKPGQISPVVETGRGYSLFRCDEIQPAQHLSKEETRQRLEQNMLRLQRKKVWDAELEKVRSKLEPVDLDLADLPDPVFLDGRSVSRNLLLAWIQRRVGAMPQTEESVSALIQNWRELQFLASRAEALGLNENPDLRSELRWKRVRLLATHAINQQVKARIQPPTEAELLKSFESHADRFLHPPEYQLAAIYFGRNQEAEHVSKAQRVCAQLQRRELGFAEAALRYSKLESAIAGGDLGWIPSRDLVRWGPVATRVIKQLQNGGFSGAIRLQDGIWAFLKKDTRPPRPMSFEEARNQVEAMLLKPRIQKSEADIRRGLLEQWKVKTFRDQAFASPNQPTP